MGTLKLLTFHNIFQNVFSFFEIVFTHENNDSYIFFNLKENLSSQLVTDKNLTIISYFLVICLIAKL